MISLILLAGGIGSRMQATIPKQYLTLKGKPIVLHSFELFSSLPEIQEIIVVCEAEYRSLFPPSTLFAAPGPRRQDSVYSGFLKTTQEMIFIHDSARPFVEARWIPLLLEAAKTFKAAALGTPVTSTIKQCNKDQLVEKTIDRSTLFEIQTPQAIERSLLSQAFDYVRAHRLKVTDDLSMVEALGFPAKIVPASPRNLKITTPFDLTLAELL